MMRRPAILSVLVAVGLGSACSSSKGPLAVIEVFGGGESSSLRVGAAIGGKPASRVFEQSLANRRFGLRLPQGASGELSLQIDEITTKGQCLGGRGLAQKTISDDHLTEVAIRVDPLPQELCLCSPTGWCWENPLPQGNTLFGVWTISPTEIWAVGALGSTFRYDGTSWHAYPSGTVANLYTIFGDEENNLYAAGERGTILQWDGKSWESVANKVSVRDLRTAWGYGTGEVWFGGEGGTLLRLRPDRTLTQEDPGTKSAIRALWGSSEENLWLVGDGGTIRRRGAFGWMPLGGYLDTRDVYAVWGVSETDLFAGGDRGLLVRISNGVPKIEPSGTTVSIQALYGVSADSMWAAGGNSSDASGLVLRRSEGVWSPVTIKSLSFFNGLYAIHGSGTDVWAVGRFGTILNWQNEVDRQVGSSNTTRTIYGLWGSSPIDVWAAGGYYDPMNRGGALLHYDGNGWSSDPRTEGKIPVLQGISGTGYRDIWAVGEAGTVLHFTGQEWLKEQISGAEAKNFRAVYAAPDGAVWIVGDAGTVLRRNNGQWGFIGVDTKHNLSAIWQPPQQSDGEPPSGILDKLLYIGGADAGLRGVLYKMENGSLAPLNIGTFSAVHAIAGVSSSDFWVLTEKSPILHHLSGTWHNVDTGTTRWLEGLLVQGPQEVWAVGQDGFIMYWNGKSWVRTISGTANDLHAIWGSGPFSLWAAGDGGTLLRKRL